MLKQMIFGTATASIAVLCSMYYLKQKHKRKVPTYTSTRGYGVGNELDFESTVMMGLALDGGLMVPSFFPQVSKEKLDSFYGMDFQTLAFEIMSMYIPRDQVSAEELRAIIDRSYATFRHEEVTPVVRSGPEGEGPKILELFHGPTFAFKDVALQFLGNLFEHFVSKRGETMTILGATSGDTGSSAIYGLRGKKGVNVFILFPEGRVSPIQERQMTTVLDENIHCLAVEGTFDDAQAIVKSCFNDRAFRDEVKLGAVNSINWARILAQIVYYFYAYIKIVPRGSGKKISFSVPTGNFGDILAGYYAKRMGLPVDQLVVATNENDILHKFFSKGEYFKAPQVANTISPSMDICVSSNFERFLYHMCNDDHDKLATMIKNFEKTGKLKAEGEFLQKCQKEMLSERLSKEEVLGTIKSKFQSYNYLLDPHSAIGVGAVDKLEKMQKISKSPMVCLACAHWGKFTDAVSQAVGTITPAFPPQLEALKTLKTRKTVLPASHDRVQAFMRKTLK